MRYVRRDIDTQTAMAEMGAGVAHPHDHAEIADPWNPRSPAAHFWNSRYRGVAWCDAAAADDDVFQSQSAVVHRIDRRLYGDVDTDVDEVQLVAEPGDQVVRHDEVALAVDRDHGAQRRYARRRIGGRRPGAPRIHHRT